MTTRWVVATVTLAACGRIGFDPGDDLGPTRSVLAIAVDVGEPLPDYPLLVTLDDTRADRAAMRADASDLRFSIGRDALAMELVDPGVAGGAPTLAFARVPVLAADTEIAVHYGGDPDPPPATSAWADEFAGVWHFEGGAARDSTTNENHGTVVGSRVAPGIAGQGLALVAALQEFVRVDDAPSLELPDFTISGWIEQASVVPDFAALINRQVPDTDFSDFFLSLGAGSPLSQVSTSTERDAGLATATTLATGTWTHLAATYGLGTLRLYIDGELAQTTPVGGGGALHSPRPLFLGAECTLACTTVANADFVDGTLDELRVERIVRPDAWIRADALSVRDQLLSYGPVLP